MAQIIEVLKNCTIATVAKSATLSNGNLTYTVGGRPGNNVHLFTKTITVASGYMFKTPPVLSVKKTSFPSNYTIVISDTGSVAGANLSARVFNVYYKIPNSDASGDVININAKAEFIEVASSGKITGLIIAAHPIKASGEERKLTIYGDAGATVTMEVLETVANPDTSITATTSTIAAGESGTRILDLTAANPNIFLGMTVTGTNIPSSTTVTSISLTGGVLKRIQLSQSISGGAASGTATFTGPFTISIGANSRFEKTIKFPTTTANKSYNVVLTRIASNSFIDSLAGLSTKTITILQFPTISMTATLINSSSNSGDWAIASPAALNITGHATQTETTFPVSWTVRAAATGEITRSNAGFSIAALSHDGALSAVNRIAQLGSTASTATFVSLRSPKVDIVNVATFSGISAIGVSGTKNLFLTIPNSLLYVGVPVSGTNIPSGTTVTAIGPGFQEITLNNTLTGATTVATFSAKSYAVISGNIVLETLGKANASTNIEINNIITLTN